MQKLDLPYPPTTKIGCLMACTFATNLGYDVANCANHNIRRDTTVAAIRDNYLASAGGKPSQLRLNLMNPNLLVSRSLPV